MSTWSNPKDRYYYPWYDDRQDRPHMADSQIKSTVVERLRANPFTAECSLKVDVKKGVVILRGRVPTRLAKRVAGDDAWDLDGVADVSNQLEVDATGDMGIDAPTVRDVMTREVVTADSWEPVDKVAARMANNDIGSVVVVNGSKPVGIVTDRDIVVRCATTGNSTADMPISLALTPTPISVSPFDSVERAVETMRLKAVRRLPVVLDDRLVGVVSLGDLARHRDPGSVLADISAAAPNNENATHS